MVQVRICRWLSREFTLPDNRTVLAETTSAYNVVEDSVTFAFNLICFIRIGTIIDKAGCQSRHRKFLLNIRTERVWHDRDRRTAIIACTSQIRCNNTGALALAVVHLMMETVI